MKYVPRNCPKCGESWEQDLTSMFSKKVVVEYNVIEENLTVKCGTCRYITKTFCDDAEEIK